MHVWIRKIIYEVLHLFYFRKMISKSIRMLQCIYKWYIVTCMKGQNACSNLCFSKQEYNLLYRSTHLRFLTMKLWNYRWLSAMMFQNVILIVLFSFGFQVVNCSAANCFGIQLIWLQLKFYGNITAKLPLTLEIVRS